MLATASANAVVAAAAGLAPHFVGLEWLPAANRYRDDTITRLARDSNAGGTPSASELAEYVAASSPLHCVDGWSYLGRAVHAHLMGDPHAARHLAYYASLRGALSLLAAGGIGVFQDRHFVLQGGAVQRVPKDRGTHQAVWLYLEEWSTSASAGALLGSAVQPANESLEDWIDQVPGGASWAAIAGSLLKDLGLDLNRLVNDRNARNVASYRPTGATPSVVVAATDAVGFVDAVWSLLEPAPGASFENLDTRFLAVALQRTFKSVHGKAAAATPAYEAFLDGVLNVVIADPARRAAYKNRLLQALTGPPFDLVTLALSRAPVTDPTHHMAAMARAASLLRVAAGCSRVMLRDASILFEDLAFWWSGLVEARGIWDVSPDADGLIDSWADVEAALDDVRAWRAGTPGSLSGLLDKHPRSMLTLGALDIVPIWEMAS